MQRSLALTLSSLFLAACGGSGISEKGGKESVTLSSAAPQGLREQVFAINLGKRSGKASKDNADCSLEIVQTGEQTFDVIFAYAKSAQIATDTVESQEFYVNGELPFFLAERGFFPGQKFQVVFGNDGRIHRYIVSKGWDELTGSGTECEIGSP